MSLRSLFATALLASDFSTARKLCSEPSLSLWVPQRSKSKTDQRHACSTSEGSTPWRTASRLRCNRPSFTIVHAVADDLVRRSRHVTERTSFYLCDVTETVGGTS